MATHVQVAHAWAHKTGRQQNGHHMHYEGPTIYSYGRHFPIARHITLPNGDPAVLFTTRSYSQSTSQHVSTVRGACRHLDVYLVEHPDRDPSVSDVDALMASADDAMGRARRARTRADWHISTAAELIERANRLIAAFGLARTVTTLDNLAADLAEIRRRTAEAAAAAQAARVAAQAEARADWMAGVSGRFYGTDEHGNAYCRISPDGTQLQTSQGASVPLEDAKRVFQAVAHCRANNKTWTRERAGSQRMRVGDFQVDRIDPTGDFKAGCHSFAWPEIARVAQSIGLAV